MLSSLVFSVTYKCPIQCDYCGVHSGPHRHGIMELETITNLIDQAEAMGTFSVIVFTGGEPSLLGKKLVSAIAYAKQKGFLTRVVTNAVWATSAERALTFLQEWKEAGLTELNYSVDDAHQAFIPLQRVKWAADAAAALKIPLLIAAKGIKRSTINPAYLEAFFEGKLKRFNRNERLQPGSNCYTWGVTIPVGWNADKLKDDDLLWPEREDCWKGPCTSVLKSVVIRYSGDVSICCGIGSDEIPETVVGNIHERPLFDIIASANDDLMVNWLGLRGPEGIINFVKEKSPGLKFREKYVGICHACHDVLSRPEVRKVIEERIDEAIPRLGLERACLESRRQEMTATEMASFEED